MLRGPGSQSGSITRCYRVVCLSAANVRTSNVDAGSEADFAGAGAGSLRAAEDGAEDWLAHVGWWSRADGGGRYWNCMAGRYWCLQRRTATASKVQLNSDQLAAAVTCSNKARGHPVARCSLTCTTRSRPLDRTTTTCSLVVTPPHVTLTAPVFNPLWRGHPSRRTRQLFAFHCRQSTRNACSGVMGIWSAAHADMGQLSCASSSWNKALSR